MTKFKEAPATTKIAQKNVELSLVKQRGNLQTGS